MTQPSLKKLLDAVREAEKLKNTEVEQWDPRTRAGMEIARNQAISNLESLNEAYVSGVRNHSVAVFLTGDGALQTEFGAIAMKLGVPAVAAKAFYSAVTSDAAASLQGGRFTPTEYAHVMHQIRAVLYDDLKVPEFMKPDLMALFTQSVSRENLVNEVARAFVATNGHGISARYLARLAAKEALASGYSQDVVPVVIIGATSEEIEALSKSGQFTGSTSIIVPLEDVKVNVEVVREVLAQTGASFAPEAEETPVEKKQSRKKKQ